jgi:EpsI family protein
MTLLGKSTLEDRIPHKLGRWSYETTSGLVLPPSDQLKEGIYNELLTRVYSAPDNSRVMLLIAYCRSQQGQLLVHRPEICYPASGFSIRSNVAHDIPLLDGAMVPAQFLVAESPARVEQLIYWTRVGTYFPQHWSDQRLALMKSRLEGVIPDGILVRISTLASDDASAARLLESFAEQMITSVDRKMRDVLIGTR